LIGPLWRKRRATSADIDLPATRLLGLQAVARGSERDNPSRTEIAALYGVDSALGGVMERSGPETGSCRTVLIVEDDEAIRDTLQFALELENYSVVTAANGKLGLELLSAIPPPSVILLDLMMPVMNGWEFADALKRDRNLSDIPVVLVTAYGDKARAIDSKGIVEKPVELEDLYRVVRQCVAPQQPAGDTA
jgi:CheY-like chemotaxis protein